MTAPPPESPQPPEWQQPPKSPHSAEPHEPVESAEEAEALWRRVEPILLGGERIHTRADIVAKSGVPPERTHEIWRALGFPLVDDDAVSFTDADVAALLVGERLIAAGLITEDSETMMTRALGQHLSRLAEWQVHTLWAWLMEHTDDRLDGDTLAEAVEALLPELELLQNHVWRRHLAAYAQRVLTTAEDRPQTRPQAVGFTDMVGYTRLTRGLGITELGQLLDRFETWTAGVVADGGGRVVKTVGDEVLYVCDTVQAAAEIALELSAPTDPDLPEVRTGLAHGPVLGRFGDVYGPAVNIAARLTSVARPGTVLVDTSFALGLAGAEQYALRALRPVSVRGYSRLRPVVLRRAG
ncbi:adenylate/guanylate cyclase domain-containing protein [Streptomyces sp. KLOTTS4A1]|uniref:adenylate/guanylate cyclase domain-containing protein n=1 Tax=Streptomyces sp. KLOTTS4A1 TaxID=3390996 RepID=UPI0039F5FCBD